MSTKRFCVFLEFSKTFDTVNYDLMIEKLEHYGVRRVILSWLLEPATDCAHQWGISDLKVISSGVPQVTKLGPLLFTMNMNDFFFSCKFFIIYMFAEDTTLMNSTETLNDRCICFDLVCLQNGITCNYLDLNVKKSELMWSCQPLQILGFKIKG